MKIDNQEFRVTIEPDQFSEYPWTWSDGHGQVRKSNNRHAEGYSDKSPGERPLNQAGRNEYQFYYDWSGAMRKAKAEGWNTTPYDAPNPALRAVQADFNRLRDFLRDEWCYMTVIVTAIDEDGNEIASDCLGMVESDYADNQADEMARDMLYRLRVNSRFRDAMACGV